MRGVAARVGLGPVSMVLAALALCHPLPCGGQEPTGTVVVHVTAAGAPAAGAVLRSGAHQTTTNDEGIGSLRLEPGERDVTVAKLGFAPTTVRVVVIADRFVAVEVTLGEPVIELASVVVSATRNERRVSDEPTRVEITDREDVEEQLTASPGHIAELLTEAGGVRVQPTSSGLGGASVRIRGLEGRYTQLLSDGLPLFGLTTEGLAPLQIPPIDLARVEVIKGVASALYGPTALGGVVDLVSQRPSNEGRILVNQTSRDAQDLLLWNARRLNPGWGYTVLGSAHRQGAADVDHDGWLDLPGYRRGVLRPRLFWTGSQSSVFVTAGLMAEDRTGGTSEGATLPSGDPLVVERDTRRVDAGGVGQFQLSPVVRLAVRGSVTRQWADGSFGASPERHRRNTLFSELALTLDRGAHVLVLGAAFARDAYVALDTPTLDYTYTSPGLFVQETWTPAPWFGTTASARLDAHSRYGTLASPRISVLFRDGTSWHLRLSAGTGDFATTPFIEATDGIDLSLLRPLGDVTRERGRSLSADLGAMVGPIEIDGSLFASVVDDPVGLRQVSGSSTDVELVNATGPTRVQGAELFARYEREPVMVTASYQYLQGTHIDVGSALRTDVPLNPRHAGGLTVVWADEEGGPRLGLEAYYTGRQALDDNPYRSVSEPYLTIDALAEMPVGPLVLFVHGEDLTDVRQSGFDPLLLPTARPGGRWTTDVWAPLAGRVINFGLWVAL